MKVIKPSVEVLTRLSGIEILKDIELAARTCYKTEDKITDESYLNFVQMILNRGHEAMIEFGFMMARIVCDRGVTHEIVRHRLFSFAQESTRYCNYNKDKFDNQLTFINPCYWNQKPGEFNVLTREKYGIWEEQMQSAENAYIQLTNKGAKPQEARAVLPNSLKTEIVVCGNLREWRHFFELRTAPTAHPQMIEVAKMALEQFRNHVPLIFDETGTL